MKSWRNIPTCCRPTLSIPFGNYYKHSESGDSRLRRLIWDSQLSVWSRQGHARKAAAIDTLARGLAAALRDTFSEEQLLAFTFVPVPPRIAPSSPFYDARLHRLLVECRRSLKHPIDVRPLVTQDVHLENSHDMRGRHLTPEQIGRAYRLQGWPRRRVLVLDDVLSTGAHFAAARHALGEAELKRRPDSLQGIWCDQVRLIPRRPAAGIEGLSAAFSCLPGPHFLFFPFPHVVPGLRFPFACYRMGRILAYSARVSDRAPWETSDASQSTDVSGQFSCGGDCRGHDDQGQGLRRE